MKTLRSDTQVTGVVADSELVEIVLSNRESVAARCRALRLLGLAPHLPLRICAVAVAKTCDPVAEASSLLAGEPWMRPVPIAAIGELAVALFQLGEGDDSRARNLCAALRERNPWRHAEGSLRVGLGGAFSSMDAEQSWEQAVLALRFAAPAEAGTPPLPVRAIVDYNKLGAFVLLAKIPQAELRSQRDVLALDALADTDTGALDLATLQAFCRSGSLRAAAQALYVHHSTVADRLARTAVALGWHLDDPADRFRAQLALCARHLAESPLCR